MNTKPNRDQPTHGMCITHNQDDVKRTLEIYKFEDGSHGWVWQTWWKPDEEPAITRMRLSNVGFALLLKSIHDLDMVYDYPLAPKPAELGNDTKDKL